ncbi:MAG: Gfo/Idh/MocA family protein, partial [Longimicrobiales bacterium]
MTALRMGVVGVGSLGFHHARLLRQMDGVDIAGIHDARADRLAEVATALELPAEASLDALLDTCDACVVAVPTEAHERIARAALERGVHVLIEKPIASSLDEADRILAAAAATGAL